MFPSTVRLLWQPCCAHTETMAPTRRTEQMTHDMTFLCCRPAAFRASACGLLILLCLPQSVAAPPSYQDDVRPIFQRHCLGCHNADDSEAGLDLSSSRTTLAGSSGGPVVIAGRPESSRLYLAVMHKDDSPAMPPDKRPLTPAETDTIRDWIAGGLLATADGQSQLREVAMEIREGSTQRPNEPAYPQDLPAHPVTATRVAPPAIALTCSPWADLIAVSGQRQILLYRPATRPTGPSSVATASAPSLTLVGVLPFPDGDIHDLRFSRNGELLVAAGGLGAESGLAVVYDVRTGRRVATVGDEYDIVLSADISADHQFVAIGTPKKMVKVFSATTGELVHRISKHTDWVTVVRFRPDGQQLASADRNGGIHVWETASGGIVFTLDEHKTKVTSLSWRGDGELLASASEDGRFTLWDMKDGWATRSIRAHEAPALTRYSRRTGVLDITFGADGRLVTAGRDRTVRLWKPDGSSTSTIARHTALPLHAAFLPDGQRIVTGTLDGQIRTFRLSPQITQEAAASTGAGSR